MKDFIAGPVMHTRDVSVPFYQCEINSAPNPQLECLGKANMKPTTFSAANYNTAWIPQEQNSLVSNLFCVFNGGKDQSPWESCELSKS